MAALQIRDTVNQTYVAVGSDRWREIQHARLNTLFGVQPGEAPTLSKSSPSYFMARNLLDNPAFGADGNFVNPETGAGVFGGGFADEVRAGAAEFNAIAQADLEAKKKKGGIWNKFKVALPVVVSFGVASAAATPGLVAGLFGDAAGKVASAAPGATGAVAEKALSAGTSLVSTSVVTPAVQAAATVAPAITPAAVATTGLSLAAAAATVTSIVSDAASVAATVIGIDTAKTSNEIQKAGLELQLAQNEAALTGPPLTNPAQTSSFMTPAAAEPTAPETVVVGAASGPDFSSLLLGGAALFLAAKAGG